MPNYLKMPKKSQVLALLELGWSYRRIEAETGVRRETVSRYDLTRRSNAAKTFPGSDASPPTESPDLRAGTEPNAAKTFAGSESKPAKTPRWTVENRQFVDRAKPAILPGRPRPVTSTSFPRRCANPSALSSASSEVRT
jgi:hypothetical protein